MAIIGRIRKHSGLAVILVGVAIAAFVLSDLFRAGPARDNNIGVVEGEEIPYADFNYKVEENIEAQKMNSEKENLTFTESFTVRQNTWNQMVNEIIMDKEFDKLGLTVTGDELFDLIQGNNPHRLIVQYFTNPETGMFDRDFVIRYLQNLDQLEPQQKRQWLNFEQFIKRDRLNQKYNALIDQGYYAPGAFAKMKYEHQKKNAEFRYAFKKYADVPDSLITYTDKDFEKYYEENKHKFEQENTRDIDYVMFEVTASQEDYEKTEREVYNIFEEFKHATNIPMFVNAVSDTRYDSTWWQMGTLPIGIDTVLHDAEVGTVVEPYFENNKWQMARLEEIEYRPDSMKAEHILIAYNNAMRAAEDIDRTREEAENLADSLYGVLRRNPAKFPALAKDMSDDPSASENSGNLGWFQDGNMVNAFNEAVVDNPTGSVVKAETPFGYHVVHVLDKTKPERKMQVAMIEREVVPSNETYQDIYIEASKFAGENNTNEKFQEAVVERGLDKRTATYLKEMGNTIPGLDYARPVIRWVFSDNAEQGSVSPVFDMEDKYLVASITEERKKGKIPLDVMKERLVNNIKNEKKAERYMKLIRENGSKNLITLAQDLDLSVDTNYTLTFDSRNLPGFGSEKKIVGTIFGMKEGDFKGPVKGQGAVFAIVLDAFGEVPELGSYSLYQKELMEDVSRRVQNNFHYNALEEKADIVDNRSLYY